MKKRTWAILLTSVYLTACHAELYRQKDAKTVPPGLDFSRQEMTIREKWVDMLSAEPPPWTDPPLPEKLLDNMPLPTLRPERPMLYGVPAEKALQDFRRWENQNKRGES